MKSRPVHIGDGLADDLKARERRSRVIFWVISGALILFVLWFLTLPALMYDMDRPTQPTPTRGVP